MKGLIISPSEAKVVRQSLRSALGWPQTHDPPTSVSSLRYTPIYSLSKQQVARHGIMASLGHIDSKSLSPNKMQRS